MANQEINTKFVSAKEIKKICNITSQTLHNWRHNSKVKYIELSSHKFLYDLNSVYEFSKGKIKKNVIYCRVSNTKQKNDLINQEEILRQYIASNGGIVDQVYSDIASGMNENRKAFNLLINDVVNGNIGTIYISFKDRLTRFGYSYFERLFAEYGCSIVVVGSTSDKTYEQELTEDLISIIHHFSMKMYSTRRSKLKQIEKYLKEVV